MTGDHDDPVEPDEMADDPAPAEPVSAEADVEPESEPESEPEAAASEADEALAAVTAERDGYLADLQRVSAEFANFRKQTEKRNAEVTTTARGQVVEAVLPVFDACEAAITHGASEVEPIYAALRGALEGVGLELIVPTDEEFDPNRHEAVISEPADEPLDVPVVTEVLRTGYAIGSRVLRPAMVKVAS